MTRWQEIVEQRTLAVAKMESLDCDVPGTHGNEDVGKYAEAACNAAPDMAARLLAIEALAEKRDDRELLALLAQPTSTPRA